MTVIKEDGDEMVTFEQTKSGDITIRIPASVIIRYTEMHPDVIGEDGEVVIKNSELFCKEVFSELMSEEEDGSTRVDRLVDEAILQAVEMGTENVIIRDEDGNEY